MLFEDKLMNEPERTSIYPPREIEKWLYDHSPADLYFKLKESVLGQDEELRKAVILVYGFLLAMTKSDFITKFHFLIEGSSGCGKSTFANALKKLVPCPVIIADASQITPAGYRGTDVTDLISTDELRKWYNCGIIIWDELDKLMEPSTVRDNDNYHRQTLENCLRMLDGGDITDRDGNAVNCNKMLFIGMGAFSQLRQQKVGPTRRSIGFGSEAYAVPTQTSAVSHQKKISRKIMADFCGSEQFLGRFTTVLHFKKLGEGIYKQIIKQTVNDIRLIYSASFALSYEQEAKIIKEAMNGEFGCCGIKSAVWETFSNMDVVITQKDYEIMHFENVLGETESLSFQSRYHWNN